MTEESRRLVDELLRWLDEEKSHLDDQSMRRVLEKIAEAHIGKARAATRWRTRAKDFLILTSVLSAAFGLWTLAKGFL